MHRLSVITLLFTALAFAADTPVLIQQPFYLQSPEGWTGIITVSWPAFRAAGGTTLAAGSKDFAVTAGALSISLYSNTNASPAFLYTAQYRQTAGADRGRTFKETWLVPLTGPVTLNDVRPVAPLSTGFGLTYIGLYAGRPSTPHLNDLAMFTDAANAGDCPPTGGSARTICAWSGAAWVPTSSAHTSPTTPRWTTLTNSQWTALTNSQWTALAN